jgi:hypothetical protein
MVNQAIPDVDVAANNTTQPSVLLPTGLHRPTGMQGLRAISRPIQPSKHVGID